MGTDLNFALQQLGPALDGLMRAVSFLGSEDFFLLLIPFIFWCVDSGLGARLLFLLISSGFVNGLLKWTFHTPRPYWIDPRLRPIAVETSYGLPSGHAQISLTVWGYLALKVRRWWLWLIAALVIFGVSLSRLYLGEHFLTDVLAGWLVGSIVLFVFLQIEPRFTRWIVPKPLEVQIATAFVASILTIILGSIVHAAISGVSDPVEWAAFTGLLGPRNFSDVVTGAAVIFGAGLGLALLKRTVHFNARGPWSKRLARFALGLIGLVVLRFGLGAIFPQQPEIIGLVFRYLRYVLILLWAVWLAPWVFVRLRLA